MTTKTKALLTFVSFVFLLAVIGINQVNAVCDASYQTYRYKSATFYVTNAVGLRVFVYNSMNDRYPRCFTTWILLNGNYVNLDGIGYAPQEWANSWSQTAPNCDFNVVYTSGEKYYDLTRFTGGKPFTGKVEVRVSSDCYTNSVDDPCYCWNVNVIPVVSQEETKCLVKIHVKDYESDTPISDAVVSWNSESYTTDYSGVVEFYVSVGTHEIEVSKNGYQTKTITINCGSCGNEIEKTVYLEKLASNCPLVIKVRDCDTDEAISDARVQIDSNTFYTDWNGEVTTTISQGSYQVSVSKTGYETYSFWISCESCGNQITRYVCLKRETPKKCRVRIYVSDCDTGSPLTYATVTWNDGEVSTGSSGIANFEVNVGTYTVTISKDGYESKEIPLSCHSCGNDVTESVCLKSIQPKCSLLLKDYSLSPEEVRIGDQFSIYAKLSMEFSSQNYGDSHADVTAILKDENGIQVAEKTKRIYFSFSGETQSVTFDFCSNVLESGTYSIYLKVVGEYGCELYKYIGSLEVLPKQICVPGEIKERTCACPTQVSYLVCKSDGSGWEKVVENCPSGMSCENGYCTVKPKCSPGYLNNYYRCEGKWVQRAYMQENCKIKWVDYKYCEYGCVGGECIAATPLKENCVLKVIDKKCENNYVLKEYQFTDCSLHWKIAEFCPNGCMNGECLNKTPLPVVYIKPSIVLKENKPSVISFSLYNKGSKASVELKITGEASRWIHIPEKVTLDAGENKTIVAAVDPISKAGEYPFSIIVNGTVAAVSPSVIIVKSASISFWERTIFCASVLVAGLAIVAFWKIKARKKKEERFEDDP